MPFIDKLTSAFHMDFFKKSATKKIPSVEMTVTTSDSPLDADEYYWLQRRATQYAKGGRMDLAIECLRKSNELMHRNNQGTKKDFLRLVEYLKKDGQFDEARRVYNEMIITFSDVFHEESETCSPHFSQEIQTAMKMGSDLIGMVAHNVTCAECSKYQGRIYSISGLSQRFPKLPDIFFKYGGPHPGCHHGYFVFFEGISLSEIDHYVLKSNRPFVDDRTPEQIKAWEEIYQKRKDAKKNREDFDFLREFLPEIAPKSLGGYVRMKNVNSEKFLQIKQAAKEMGREIGREEFL